MTLSSFWRLRWWEASDPYGMTVSLFGPSQGVLLEGHYD